MKASRIVIIGAGLGGLAAGIRLAADGYRVKIFEQENEAGGWLRGTRFNGFTFENGGSILTMPSILESLFAYAGKKMADALDLIPMDAVFQAIFPDNNTFLMFREPGIAMLKNRFTFPEDQKALYFFNGQSGTLFDDLYLSYGRSIPEEKRLPFQPNSIPKEFQPEKSALKMAEEQFRDPNLQTLFGSWPLFAGSDPRSASHLFRLIPAAIQRHGAFSIQGGSEALLKALVTLFIGLGGEIALNSKAQAIQIFNHAVSGVRLRDGSIIQADAVISDADAMSAFLDLIDSDQITYPEVAQARKREPSFSLAIYHFGVRSVLYERTPLLPHNFIFPKTYAKFLQELFSEKKIPEQLFYYLRIPSKINPEYAPEGCECLSVFVPAPCCADAIDWEQFSYSFRNRILDDLQFYFISDIRKNIIAEKFISPDNIRSTFGSWLGNAFSFELSYRKGNLTHAPNRCRGIKGLYLTGNGAHPGPFIPGVLMSAELAAAAIAQDFSL